MHECVPINKWGLRLLFADQDSRANPLGWQSMVALLCLWELTEVERQQMSETWERNMYRHVQTQKHVISKLARI